jgi:hypothetical protein
LLHYHSYLVSNGIFHLLRCLVAGLPAPRRDHALIMIKFAQEILIELATVTSGLEKSLGPGTAALTARVGVGQQTELE